VASRGKNVFSWPLGSEEFKCHKKNGKEFSLTRVKISLPIAIFGAVVVHIK
jgi:hypothetical protein